MKSAGTDRFSKGRTTIPDSKTHRGPTGLWHWGLGLRPYQSSLCNTNSSASTDPRRHQCKRVQFWSTLPQQECSSGLPANRNAGLVLDLVNLRPPYHLLVVLSHCFVAYLWEVKTNKKAQIKQHIMQQLKQTMFIEKAKTMWNKSN